MYSSAANPFSTFSIGERQAADTHSMYSNTGTGSPPESTYYCYSRRFSTFNVSTFPSTPCPNRHSRASLGCRRCGICLKSRTGCRGRGLLSSLAARIDMGCVSPGPPKGRVPLASAASPSFTLRGERGPTAYSRAEVLGERESEARLKPLQLSISLRLTTEIGAPEGA